VRESNFHNKSVTDTGGDEEPSMMMMPAGNSNMENVVFNSNNIIKLQSSMVITEEPTLI
jgi:hypothetical protein